MHDKSGMNAQVETFLKAAWPEADVVHVDSLKQIFGGWSKRMFALEATISQGTTQTQRSLILRINAPEQSAIMRNHRYAEHALLQRLRHHTRLPVPESYAVDDTHKIFGAEAMLLERLPGNTEISRVPHDEIQGVAEHLLELIAELHTTSRERLNPDGLFDDPNGWGVRTETWDAYIESSCAAWREHYADRAFDTLPVIYDSFLTLRRNKPRPLPLVLVHGELNPNNLITRDGKVVGLIDWERSHIGDPREDLAWFRYFERAMAGTSLVPAVKKHGGYLGYYNHLTGFNVSEAELDYFTAFSHADVSYGPYSSITRRLKGEHDDILATYLLAEAITAQLALTRVLSYGT